MSARVLFLGGAGMIGSAVLAEAVTQGLRPTVVTRGEPSRPVPDDVEQLRFDVRDIEALDAAVGLELPVELDDLAEHIEALGLPPGHNGAPSDEQPVVCHA